MRDALVTIFLFGWVPLILIRPWTGALAWAVISYFNPHRLTWGFAYHVPWGMVLGIPTLLAWLFSKEKKTFPLTTVSVILIVYTVWVCITTLFALEPDLAVEKWSKAMKIIGMTFLTMAVINSRDRLNWLIWIICASFGFYALRGGLFALMSGGAHRVYGPLDSFIEDNNALALACIMVLPLFRYLQLQATKAWMRWGLAGFMFLMLLSILASYSRGAFVALIVMSFMFWLRSRRRFLLGVIGLLALGGAFSYMPAAYFDRLSTIKSYEEDQSADNRFEAWTFAYKVATARPLTGGGFSAFISVANYNRYYPIKAGARNAHSIWFEALGEHGFVGLFLFLGLMGSAIVGCSSIMKKTRNHPELAWAHDLCAMVQVGVISYGVGGAFLNLATFDLYYHLVATVVITSAIVKTTLAQSSAAVAPAGAAPAGAEGPKTPPPIGPSGLPQPAR
ncbi:MAG: putative O-glycosylation ligase, exosortase A system-associated [Alphaproteobacteria bacterium]